MVAEEIAEGHVTWKSFKLLLSSLGGDHPLVFYLLVMVGLLGNEWTFTFQVWFIGYWGSQYEHHPAAEVPVYLCVSPLSMGHEANAFISSYLGGYMAIIVVFCCFFSTSYLVSMHGSIRASRVINAKLIDSILGGTLRCVLFYTTLLYRILTKFRWLDETPVGRIITRCTQDIRAVDGPIPQSLLWVTDCVSGIFAKLGSIVLFTPIFLWPGLTVTIIGLSLGNMYLKAQLSVKRETRYSYILVTVRTTSLTRV
jgi:hypothetical protein